MRILLIFLLFCPVIDLNAEVVINELYYDPPGSDSGYEWLELYNSGDDLDLSGWSIQKGGSSFETMYVFPEVIILSGCYLLIAEENVPAADLIAPLAFQNGGSATDGVRIVAPDDNYSDTILYDSPNTNELPDDSGNIGTSFAPDVVSGHSLARISNGWDTDQSGDDFFDCEIPTPGAPNFFPVDLELTEFSMQDAGNGEYQVNTVISNLSTGDVDNLAAWLEIVVNSQPFVDFYLPGIPALSVITQTVVIGYLDEGYHVTEIYLNYQFDIELNNNYGETAALVGESPVIINEIMFHPLAEGNEWIELYNRSSCGYDVDNFIIIDEIGGIISFSGYIDSGSFLVICEDQGLFLAEYPEVLPEILIEALTWTPLNNTTETLFLSDSCGICLEEVSYEGSECSAGVSLERINPALFPSEDNFTACLNGATPGSMNSVYVEFMPAGSSLWIVPQPFSPWKDEHTVIGVALPELISRVTIRIFDLAGRHVRTITDQTLQAARFQYVWDGSDGRNRKLIPGIYLVVLEAVGQETESVYENVKTAVISP